MTEAYPLHWPENWQRSKSPGSSQFKTSISGALKNVNKSIELFAKDSRKKVESVLISSNVTLGNQRPGDSGVAVYFTWDGISTCIAVDRYAKVEDNLQAIHHCIEAERTKLRHGGINLVRAAFRGYAALPPGDACEGDWWTVLGLSRSATKDEIKNTWMRVRSKLHPDNGGDGDTFIRTKAAYEQAMGIEV